MRRKTTNKEYTEFEILQNIEYAKEKGYKEFVEYWEQQHKQFLEKKNN